MARTQISIKLEGDLLKRVDRLAEAAGVSRTAVIERALKNDVPEQEAFQKSLENPAIRAIHKQITRPGVLQLIAKIANEPMSDEVLAKVLEQAPRQREAGRKLQAERNAAKGHSKAGGA